MSALYEWLVRAAEAHSLDKALLADGAYLSWRGLLKTADDRASELQRMGVGKGDWVGLQLDNSPNFLILGLAVSKLGAVVVPMDPKTDSRTVHHLRDTFALRAVVAPSPEIRSSVGAERLRGTMLWCSSFQRGSSLHRPSGEAELALVLLETDSLSRWRAVARTAESLERSAKAVIEHFDVDGGQRLLSAFPTTAAIAWDLALLPALYRGATLILRDDPSTKVAGRALHRELDGGLEAGIGLEAAQLAGDWAPPVRADAPRLHDQTEMRFKEIASNQLGTPLDTLIPESSFMGDFGADPLDIEEMFDGLASELGVALPGEFDPDKIETVGDALDYIREHLIGKHG